MVNQPNPVRPAWVPDYYPAFSCKGGSCRHSCCEGWPISLSMQEYFRLLSLDCSPELKRRIDTGLHLAQAPTLERYAQLSPNWLGFCPLHRRDGLCGLQAECGESALCEICRLYPRSPRDIVGPECACSNSCERTLELLFDHPEPMTFEQDALPLTFPAPPEDLPEAIARHYIPLRRRMIDHLQDRKLTLPRRLCRMGADLRALSPAVAHLDDAAIDGALAGMPEAPAAEPDGEFTLSFLSHINQSFGLDSGSVRDYARHAIDLLELDDGEPSGAARARYEEARARFRASYPDWEVRFEQILVNHCFYESFPFADRHETLWEEFLSLAAVYAYSAFLAVTWTYDHPGETPLIDVLSAAFRLIDHSAFDYNAAVILGKRLRATEGEVDGLIEGAV